MSADNLDEAFNAVVDGLTFGDANQDVNQDINQDTNQDAFEDVDEPCFDLVNGRLCVNIGERLCAVIGALAADIASSARELDTFAALECAPRIHDDEINQAYFAMSYGPAIVANNAADLEAVARITQNDTVDLSVAFQWCRGLNMMRLLTGRAEQAGAVARGSQELCDAVLTELLRTIAD